MAEEWGPWVQHDGGGAPEGLTTPARIQIEFIGPGIRPFYDDTVTGNWGGFWWRWKTVKTGWFSSVKRRVCDDPAYAPIIRYRIRKPRGLIILENLIADLPAPVTPKVDA